MHLFLYGDPEIDTSAIIQSAISKCGVKQSGFRTRAMMLTDSVQVYLNPAGAEPIYNEDTLVAIRSQKDSGFPYNTGRFDALGLKALKDGSLEGIVVMDRLCFTEEEAPLLCNRILQVLDSSCRVLGAIKEGNDPFLLSVKRHNRVKTLRVTKDNAEEASRQVEEFIKKPTLAEALCVPRGITCLVGGGGKTSLMNRLGRELKQKGKVILCTSTHVRQPDVPMLLDPSRDEVKAALEKEPLLFIGAKNEQQKLGPCSLVLSGEVKELADYVICEADGSRQLPLKAPADHEPVLLPGTDLTVAVAGMTGIGKPIKDTVHRPERYTRLIGKFDTDIVTPFDAAKVLSHPEGQRKGVKGRFAVLLNQAEQEKEFQFARECAANLEEYVVIAALRYEEAVIECWRNATCVW